MNSKSHSRTNHKPASPTLYGFRAHGTHTRLSHQPPAITWEGVDYDIVTQQTGQVEKEASIAAVTMASLCAPGSAYLCIGPHHYLIHCRARDDYNPLPDGFIIARVSTRAFQERATLCLQSNEYQCATGPRAAIHLVLVLIDADRRKSSPERE